MSANSGNDLYPGAKQFMLSPANSGAATPVAPRAGTAPSASAAPIADAAPSAGAAPASLGASTVVTTGTSTPVLVPFGTAGTSTPELVPLGELPADGFLLVGED